MNYKPRLDGLRGVAIAMVLLGHFLYFVGNKFESGFYGVDLFFVLSGFLITSILLAESGKPFSSSYKKFLMRRALRIFPIYYLVFIFLLIINTNGISTDWPFLATYTYNFRAGSMRGWEKYLYAPYWSLSVEEQFYFFFPFIVLLLNKRPRWLLFIFITIILIAFSERSFHLLGMKTHFYVNTVTNMGALSIGAMGAWFTKRKMLNQKFFNSLTIELLVLVVLAIELTSHIELLTFMITPVLNLYLVIKASSFSFKVFALDKILTHKWSLFIGRISYGIYVYHIMVMYFFSVFVFDPLWNKIPFDNLGYFSKLKYNETLIKFPFATILTLVVAYLSFRYLEAPVLKLKDRYFKKDLVPGKTLAIQN